MSPVLSVTSIVIESKVVISKVIVSIDVVSVTCCYSTVIVFKIKMLGKNQFALSHLNGNNKKVHRKLPDRIFFDKSSIS
jgi:hypothetical protein